MAGMHVRWMIRRDMADVLRIENAVFRFSWSEDEFIRVLRQRNAIGMVVEHNDRVLGYMIYELHQHRLHLLNFAVDPAHHRKGYGRRMMEKLAGKLTGKSYRRHKILCEVRETNLAAQQFLAAMGFKATSIIRGFYDDSKEDAYVMQYLHPELVLEEEFATAD